MTEVTTYPHVHHRFGGYFHRLLAPAPEHRHTSITTSSSPFFPADLFRHTALELPPMDYQNQYGLPRSSSSDDRSMSLSSAASSASHHPSFKPEPRTLSPASVLSEPASSVLARTHHALSLPHHQQQQQQQQQPSYVSPAPAPAHGHTLPSALFPGSSLSQYPSAQIGSQIPLYSQVPSPRLPVFGQQSPSPYNFQYSCLPSQPSPLSVQNYPPMYPSYASPSTYRHAPPPAPVASYRQSGQSPHLLQLREPQANKDERCWIQEMPPEVIKLIRENVGYLQSRRVLRVSRWFRDNFDASQFSTEDLIVGIAEAEKNMKRYYITGKSGPGGTQLPWITPSGSYACYHCFKMRSPENFELFIWHFQTAGAGNDDDRENDGDDTDSHHSMTTATTSGPSTPRQRNPSLSNSSSSSWNPYYDPTLTGSSIREAREAQAAARSSGSNNPSGSPAAPILGFTSLASRSGGGLGGSSEPTTGPPLAGRVKSTFGIRRFCIDCGVRKGYYKSKDLIEVHGAKNLVKWVCGCLIVRKRSESPSCGECGLHSPYEPPGGRARRTS